MLASKEQHKRSVLGPLWNTIGTLVMVLMFGLLYAKLLGEPAAGHLPYVASGLIIWLFYSATIVGSCTVFVSNTVFIQQMTLPKTVYLYRLLSLHLIDLFYAIVIILLPILWLTAGFTWVTVLAIPGFVLVMMQAFSLSLILAVVALRFRDVAPLVGHIMRPLMFLTPIIWNANSFPERAVFTHWNPFFHIVEVFRGPLLGSIPSTFTYIVVALSTAATCGLALILFSRYRSRVAYWV